ncbi:hypothetical protein [Piscinibacter sakaiensis]|uniref:hypothetical protein n=1 Tax=Piscinibacter sakaiensis TaxID=1547922 RepID=UPI003AAE758D
MSKKRSGFVVLSSLVVLLLIIVGCSVWRRLAMCDLTLVRRDEAGLLRIELRRRTEMRTHADGRGGQSFPEPAETRHLTWLFCELPVWSRVESIGLPSSCEGRIDKVQADEFDRHFTPAFQRRPPAKASRAAAV